MPWFGGGIFSCCCQPEVEDVKELDYAHSCLKEVPSSVFSHERTLEELNLEANRINELPRALFHCHELRVLDLADNDLKVLPPAIASLINLQHLNLSKNTISNISDNVKCCKQLVYLNASVNPLDKMPDGITQLIALEELYLADTFLEFLPANFGRLSKLRILDVRENRLNTLPKSMSRLANLQILDIGRNEFSDLPEVIGNLPELRDLWADSNKIRTIPPLIGNLRKLVNLDLGNNNIQWIAPYIERCQAITYLILTGNELVNLPEEIGNLKHLAMLKIDDNDIEILPRSIGKLTNLEELVMSQNVIESIPPTIGLLRKITTINADDNRLSELPSELCSCTSLRVLSVRNNLLSLMPAEIGHLTSVRVINVADNMLRNLPVSILSLTNLNALWLSTNQSTPLTNLQQEIDSKTGLTVCVNFMFPQQEQERNRKNPELDENKAMSMERPPRPHIRFADSTDLRNSSRLTRAPTPYPKELRSMAKHARILNTKPIIPLNVGDIETPVVDDKGRVVIDDDDDDDDDDRPRWPLATMKSMASIPTVKLIEQPQVHHEGCESDPLLSPFDEEKYEPGLPVPPADDQYLGLPAPNQFGAGENPALSIDNSARLISTAAILATRSDVGPPMPRETAASRVDEGLSGKRMDFPAMNVSLSMPETGATHYGRSLVDQAPQLRLIEHIPSEVDLTQEAGHSDNPSFFNGADSTAYSLPAQAKEPPPYHIAAIHSKQAAFFRNTSNGEGITDGSNEYSDLTEPSTTSGIATPLNEPKIVPLDNYNPTDKEDSTVPDSVPTEDVTDGPHTDLHLNFSGLTWSDTDSSPRTPSSRCSAGPSGIPLLRDKTVHKRPRESLSKIPSITSKDSKMPVAKKPIIVTSSNSPAKLNQPSGNSPTKLIQPSSNFPTKLIQPSGNSPTKLIQPSSNSPTKLIQPSGNFPTKLIQPSSNFPTKPIQPSGNFPTKLIQPSGNSPTKLLQPGFHATQLPLPKSPTVTPFPEHMKLYSDNSSTNGSQADMEDTEGENSENENGAHAEKSILEANVTTEEFKSRIPSRMSPVKVQAPPNSPTSPTWVFGQHKNPTVFPLTFVKNPSLGFSICAGTATADKPDSLGIYVDKVEPDGPASGALMPGDKILEVDGVDFSKIEYDQAVGIMEQTKNVIGLMISRQK